MENSILDRDAKGVPAHARLCGRRRRERLMQLLLVRHALPLRSEPGQGADPDLSDEGRAQVTRLPEALAGFPISRLLSSPQRRAIQTAEPVAATRELAVEIDDRLAEYDRDLPSYIPIEQIREEFPEE